MATTYQCVNCGSSRVFDPNSGTLKCPNCETEEIINAKAQHIDHPLANYTDYLQALEQKNSEKTIAAHEPKSCTHCGAIIEMDENSTATTCPYCDSPFVSVSKQMTRIPPDGILPFKVNKNKVDQIFRDWLKGRWLAPSSLKRLAEKGRIQAVYLPFWVFDAHVDCVYKADGGIHRQETFRNSKGEMQTRIVTDWYPTKGSIHHFFDDVAIIASQSVDRSLVRGIRNDYSTAKTYAFDDRFLAGFGAEIYGIEMPDAHNEAVREMNDSMYVLVQNDVLQRYNEVRNIRMNLNFSDEKFKQLLLPIYVTAYGFEGKTYQVLVNGETGEISGEYPKSYLKIALIIFAVAAFIMLYYYLTQ